MDPEDIVLLESLDDYDHLHSRKAEYLLPTKFAKGGKNPTITIEFFEGELKGTNLKFQKNLMYQLKAEYEQGIVPDVKTSFTIGKSQQADYQFAYSTLKNIQCKVEFNSMWGWQISDKLGEDAEVSSTYVYASNKQQQDQHAPSYFIQLFTGMVLAAADYQWSLTARNIDDRFLANDLFQDDKDRFFEETEDDVRKLLTGV